MKVITKELYKLNKNLKQNYVLDFNKLKEVQDFFKSKKNQINKIEIYDLTKCNKLKEGEIVLVKDHINKSGINPIINNKKLFSKGFKDIGNIYTSKNGIVTTCCGKTLNNNFKYPSHYLCVYVVLLYYIGYKNIEARLVNHD